jgi:uncharacterized protein YkwD
MTSIVVPARRRVRSRSAGAVLAIVLLALAAAGCMPADAKSFVDRTNALRTSVGVPALKENDTLTRKAEEWAQHMAATGKLEHSNLSDGVSSLSWTALGENVGYSSPSGDTLKLIHDLFVSSSGHRANLVNRDFTHMGVGVATDKAGTVWVAEVFARL